VNGVSDLANSHIGEDPEAEVEAVPIDVREYQNDYRQMVQVGELECVKLSLLPEVINAEDMRHQLVEADATH
jgi:hypothetical protein